MKLLERVLMGAWGLVVGEGAAVAGYHAASDGRVVLAALCVVLVLMGAAATALASLGGD